MTLESTARLALPMLQPGQAQKELYHNEALALLDIAVAPAVVAIGLTAAPPDPEPGQCWIVGAGATGEWSGADGMLAGWTAGGWRFVAPRQGMTLWSVADGCEARFAGESWIIGEVPCRRVLVDGVQLLGPRQPAIVLGSGGTVIDGEARAAIAAMLTALQAHGLIG